MDLAVQHPGLALLVLALGLLVAGAILRRVVFLAAGVALVCAIGMFFPGPRALAAQIADAKGISGRAACAWAGVSSWDALSGAVAPGDLPECSAALKKAPRAGAKGR